MTPVDRIFTRIGATDRILEGKSTFFVEMEETKNIIEFATFKSLAIVDELGRGTSTFDGYSIAHSVLNYLIHKVKCRSLYSTHYHMLVESFRGIKGVENYHMACKFTDRDVDKITFLYKFVKGECPMSFGLNVARMAGMNKFIISRAKEKADEFASKMAGLYIKLEVENFNEYKTESESETESEVEDEDEEEISIEEEEELEKLLDREAEE